MLWQIWLFRDLTSGDTSSYFLGASLWAERLQVNIVWSPVYTAFYGTLFALTGDADVATTAHRVVIVMAASFGVLAVLRQLLPPALALAVAAWWTVLPINFNTLYEVHLFALLPLLAIWLVAAKFDRPYGRGIVLASLAATAVLVRNELATAVLLYAAICAVREVREAARDGATPINGRLWAYALPMTMAVVFVAAFYSRSHVRGPEVRPVLAAKHAVNMCQVYAFGYGQRHPEWKLSPWTECYGLAETTFGNRTPSLRQMVAANPRAVFEHFRWNLSLTPAGLMLALFNGTWGGSNPDYAPVEHPGSAVAAAAALLALALIAAGAAVLYRDGWRFWWTYWFESRRGVWLVMAAVASVTIPIILTQRPRPSYLFGLTVTLMAVVGSAIHVLTRRWPAARDIAASGVAVLALLIVPPYFAGRAPDRPLADAYHALAQWAPAIGSPAGKVVIGDYASELTSYARLTGVRNVADYSIFSKGEGGQTFQQFLDQEQVSVLFVHPRIAAGLRMAPGAAALFADPAAFGWRLLTTTSSGKEFALLLRSP